MAKLSEILQRPPTDPLPIQPAQILPHLYIGNKCNIRWVQNLQELGITHVLNCAGGYFVMEMTKKVLDPIGIVYKQFYAKDDSNYNMRQHVDQAVEYINTARDGGGVVLVNCNVGINRSGFICTAYLMISEGIGLLQALETMKEKRTRLLSNRAFQLQLLREAKQRGLL